MVQDFARDAARIITCKFGVSCTFFFKILQELVQDCARLCKKRDISRASLACKILARFLQFRFCWVVSRAIRIFFFYGGGRGKNTYGDYIATLLGQRAQDLGQANEIA